MWEMAEFFCHRAGKWTHSSSPPGRTGSLRCTGGGGETYNKCIRRPGANRLNESAMNTTEPEAR